MTTLSELWDDNAPRPWWRRALDVLTPDDPLERAAALVATAYVLGIALTLAVVMGP